VLLQFEREDCSFRISFFQSFMVEMTFVSSRSIIEFQKDDVAA
jgi:hypothetical protein